MPNAATYTLPNKAGVIKLGVWLRFMRIYGIELKKSKVGLNRFEVFKDGKNIGKVIYFQMKYYK